MKITRQQEKAVMQLFTARGWPQRAGAIVILLTALFGWMQHNGVQPGQMQKGGILQGAVVSIADGDTIIMRDADKKEYKLRLAYIDAPEKAMPYGAQAQQHLRKLLENQQVEAQIDDVDRYGRGVARIRQNGIDINYAQLAQGYAWHYAQYAQKNQTQAEFARYRQAQEAARQKHAGLWQDRQPDPPWQWRAAQRLEE